MYQVIIAGGGAAGMFAAITAARNGASVLLLERGDRLGKKLNITGKGRCNVTNDCGVPDVLKNIPHNSRFLYSALYGFTPADTMAFFEAAGCPLKTERGNRVFPVSDRASDIIDALKREMKAAGVAVRTGRVRELLQKDGRVCGVKTGTETLYAPAVILATGGMSYPATGSTGDGYALAKSAGHTVTDISGSLVPLEEAGSICSAMQGLSLRNVSLRLLEDGKPVYEEFGELLFTHFGLSGPVVLSASAHMREGKKHAVSIDLKPALDEQKLNARILRDFGENKNRTFENALSGLFHKTMIPVIVERSGIPADTRVNSVTKEQRRALLELTKRFTVEIAGKRPVEEAIITSGGVAVNEINPKTMESRLLPGLYFAGELIDCDAYTGGFNLQIAWATAFAAGTASAQACAGES